ncbi:MAG: flagellar motor switch protein FliN [Methylomicrobium sp.]
MRKDPIEADDFRANAYSEAADARNKTGKTPAVSEEALSLDALLDVPVTLAIEFGRTQINIGELLKLKQGSIVELDRTASEPLDILINGTLVARGEVVVVNEKFGIRLTDIITPPERIKRLA